MKKYQALVIIAIAVVTQSSTTQASILSFAMTGFPAATVQARAPYTPSTSNAAVVKWGYQGKFLDQNQNRAPANLTAPMTQNAQVMQKPLPIAVQAQPSAAVVTNIVPIAPVAVTPVVTAASGSGDQASRSMVTTSPGSAGTSLPVPIKFIPITNPQFVPLPIGGPTVLPVDHSLHPFKRPIQYGAPNQQL